jgi:hypothetical protein
MTSFVVRRRAAALGAAGALTLFAACTDKRVSQLDTGITRDSAVTLLAPGAKGRDSFPNVYTKEKYLIGGKTYEVLYFSPTDKKFGKDTVAWKAVTPVVFVENKLVAKGWPQWDSISTANHISLKKR